jgi:hypothetical protein
MDSKHKHLDYIHSAITRMANYSFIIKVWSLNLATSLFVIANRREEQSAALIVCLPIALFWALDGFFLSQERQYRDLFSATADKKPEDIDFCMNIGHLNKGNNTIKVCLTRPTVAIFHGLLLTVMLLAIFYFKF